MLSLGNSDTNSCVMYLENYLDCVENLPDDLQKHISRMRELDISYQGFLKDIESLATQYDECINLKRVEEKFKLLRKAQTTLISAQELGDEKLQIIQQLQDLIEYKTRSLDIDYRNVDNGSREQDTSLYSNSINSNVSTSANNSLVDTNFKEQTGPSSTVSSNNNSEQRQSKRVRRGRGDDASNNGEYNSSQHYHHHSEHGGSIPMPRVTATILINNQKKHRDSNTNTNKKKKRKTNKQNQKISSQKEDDSSYNSKNANDDDDEDQSIDPDEPTYCLCDQISYGEMICCDNDLCPIEWFHFSCVSLSTKPKGKWFCPKCRGDRSNVMKPKAQFLKELERYNREKEGKARSY